MSICNITTAKSIEGIKLDPPYIYFTQYYPTSPNSSLKIIQFDFTINYDAVLNVFSGSVINNITLINFPFDGAIELFLNQQLIFYHKDIFSQSIYSEPYDIIEIANFDFSYNCTGGCSCVSTYTFNPTYLICINNLTYYLPMSFPITPISYPVNTNQINTPILFPSTIYSSSIQYTNESII